MINIYVDNILVDFDDIEFNIIDSIADLTGVNASTTPISDNISLPITATNKKVFGFNDMLGTDNYWEGTGRIEVDGIVKLSGTCKLLSVTDTFEIQIIDDSDQWAKALGEDKLSDLDFSSLDHTLNETSIAAATSGNYIYPLVNYGFSSLHRWSKDFRPWLKVSHILDKIFSSYTIDSDIIDTGDIDDLYIKMVEPAEVTDLPDGKFCKYHKSASEQVYSAALSAGTQTISLSAYHLEFNTADIESDLYKSSGGVYSFFIPHFVSGSWQFKCDLSTTLSSTDVTLTDFFIVLKIKDTTGTTIASTSVAAGTDFTNDISIETDALWLPTTTSTRGYYADISFVAHIDMANANTVTFSVAANDSFEAYGYKSIGSGYSYSFDDNMPDIKLIDIVKELRMRQNLNFFLNQNTDTLFIEPYDDFYTSTEIDWTGNLDKGYLSQSTIKHPEILEFKNKVDSNDKFKDLSLADESISLLNGEGTETNNSMFAKLYTYTDYRISLELPAIQKKDTYINGDEVYLEPEFYYTSPLMMAELISSTSSGTWSLNGTSKTTFVKIGNADFDTSYYDTWKEIQEGGRVISGEFTISQAELSQIKEYDSDMFITSWRVIKHKGMTFKCRINKITTNPVTKQTKVELIYY
jgi:hypothetical protein